MRGTKSPSQGRAPFAIRPGRHGRRDLSIDPERMRSTPMEAKEMRASLNELPRATGKTVAENSRTPQGLKDQVLRIKMMTEKYPVFLFVAGQGYRFESPAHVDEFIAMLQREIDS